MIDLLAGIAAVLVLAAAASLGLAMLRLVTWPLRRLLRAHTRPRP